MHPWSQTAIMATPLSAPEYTVHEGEDGTRSIDIHDWHIEATTKVIVSASEADELQTHLGIPLPEMTFGNNTLTIKHKPTGWKYTFDTSRALEQVKNGELGEGDGGVKVGYADKWLQSRTEPGTELPMPETVSAKPYDWTYTTIYAGHEPEREPPSSGTTSTGGETSSKYRFVPADPENRSHSIPMEELTRPDPIHFYAEVPLFEDELHDNGSSNVLVRLRVMPGCFFILSRFTLRVDNVLFRTFDTRIFHSFASELTLIIRETSGWEAPYEDVKRLLPGKDDLTPLTDPTFIWKTLSSLPRSISQRQGAGTKWRGMGSRTFVLTLDPGT